MGASRQDGWNEDEDLLLAEIVLRHIRESSTQLAAFEEVGAKLSRTAAACGFRWNSTVRKQYQQAIDIAKKQRKSVKLAKTVALSTKSNQVEAISMDTSVHDRIEAIVLELEALKSDLKLYEPHAGEIKKLKQTVENLNTENESLRESSAKLQREYASLEEDYQSVINIIERARKMVVMDDDHKVRFQMDANGNLERINK